MLEDLIYSFGLTICLRVICRRQLELSAEGLVDCPPYPTRELCTSVADNTSRETMLRENVIDDEVGELSRVELGRGRYEYRPFS